ncbi:Protein-L-isoaspartate O-methyltransferase [Diplonema papillatum]|nr:Protein-L-isoaspartate O-methyltransferase [Diplonema papillatum]
MSWRCSGRSNAELVENMFRAELIRSPRVKAALLRIDRGNYVRPGTDAYADSPQPIGCSVTISAPHMHAECLERLEPYLQPGDNALDLGSGSGYLTAAFQHLVGPQGKAFGIEYVEALVPWSITNLRRDGFGKELDDGSLQLIAGDGSLGWPDKSIKFSAIHVGAAAPALPKPLVDALAAPGRMIIPVGVANQLLMQVDKDEDGAVTARELTAVRYVPFHMKHTEVFTP